MFQVTEIWDCLLPQHILPYPVRLLGTEVRQEIEGYAMEKQEEWLRSNNKIIQDLASDSFKF